MTENKPRLLDQVRQIIRIKHYSLRTEESYINWIKRFIFFHNKKYPIEMRERIEKAIKEGLKARSEYYKSIELPDEQELGSPASEEQICQLEKDIGIGLPKSYRLFLTIHDGWKMIQGDVALLSVSEQLNGDAKNAIDAFKKDCEEYSDDVGIRSLVIGLDDSTPTKILLDPKRLNNDGEWSVVVHHHGEEGTYGSFIDWLEQSAKEFTDLDEDFDGEIK